MNCTISYEELAALSAGDLPPEREGELHRHSDVCKLCRARLAKLTQVDNELNSLAPPPPSAPMLLEVRRALGGEVRGVPAREVMTLAEAAEFLRVRADDACEVLDELPLFEIAGKLRVRRSRLLAWVEERECRYARERAESDVARMLSSFR